jgi:hypothetical protein
MVGAKKMSMFTLIRAREKHDPPCHSRPLIVSGFINSNGSNKLISYHLCVKVRKQRLLFRGPVSYLTNLWASHKIATLVKRTANERLFMFKIIVESNR